MKGAVESEMRNLHMYYNEKVADEQISYSDQSTELLFETFPDDG